MNRIKSVMLLTLLSLILMAIGGVVGGQSGALTILIISFAINLFSYWNCDTLALRSYHAQPLTEAQVPELFDLVRGLARNAGIPMPRLYIIPSDVPNAFATGRNPSHGAVAVTEGLISLLNRDELAGVISHELSHIRHRDTLIMTLAATIATAISYIANIAQWAAIFGGGRDSEGRSANPIALLATIIVAPLAAAMVQMALSRSREFMADESGAEISRKPLALASALQKLDDYAHRRLMAQANPASSGLFIINPFSGVQGVAHLFSTHPSTEERIKRLREIATRIHS
ncbi:MAG: zinc metalloprotease HtpX [Dialister sp.]|nr:zinc metalloprotease HtpX [Dialister sp.]